MIRGLLILSGIVLGSIANAASGIATSALSTAQEPIALVYDGDGACPEDCAKAAADVATSAGFRVHFLNANHWTAAEFAQASVYIQPGGHSVVAAATLSHDQKERLRKFVAAGGNYVGFCAGAFLASSRVQRQDGTYIDEETFGLIPMTTQMLSVNSEAAISSVTWNYSPRQVYWEGGPYFETPLAPGVQVMATYANGQIASVRASYGKGRVYVTGFHPEAPQWWRDYYKMNDTDGLDTILAADMLAWATSPR